PAPALRTAQRAVGASIVAAPPKAWRTTIASGCIAIKLRPVSSSVSPLVVDDDDAAMLIASADRRLAASSNDVRVRVDASKNRLITVRPRRLVSFLIGSSASDQYRSP